VTALDLPGQISQGLESGILSDAEARYLADYDRRVMEIIDVDDFSADELGFTPSTERITDPSL